MSIAIPKRCNKECCTVAMMLMIVRMTDKKCMSLMHQRTSAVFTAVKNKRSKRNKNLDLVNNNCQSPH